MSLWSSERFDLIQFSPFLRGLVHDYRIDRYSGTIAHSIQVCGARVSRLPFVVC